MKVKELIELLSKLPPELSAVVPEGAGWHTPRPREVWTLDNKHVVML